MFKLKTRYLLLPILSLLFLLVFPKYAIEAAKIEVGDYTLDKQAIVEDDLYVSGDKIIINGIVDGDLVAMGQNILIDGTVTGDLYVFGTTVTIAGNIYGNTMVAGSSVSLSGTVRENIYVAAMMADLNGSFNKDIAALTGTFKLGGSVGDDVRVASGQVISNASIGGDFLIGGDNYTVDENSIYGELVTSNKSILFDTDDFRFSKRDFLGFNIGLAIVNFVGMYIVGVILILLAPVKTLQIEKKIVSSWEDFVKTFAIGLVVLFTIPLPLFLLTITLVGAPLAFLITGVLLFLAIFGIIWTESAIGHQLLLLVKREDDSRFLSLFVGRGITSIVRLIPVLGAMYSLSLMVVTVGAVIRMKYDVFSTSRKKKEVTKKKK